MWVCTLAGSPHPLSTLLHSWCSKTRRLQRHSFFMLHYKPAYFFSFFGLGELMWSLSADWLKHVFEEATISVVYDARELGRRSRSESQPSQKAVVVTQLPTRGCACRAADVIPCYWETETLTTTCDGDTQEGTKLTRIIPHILCIFLQVQISAHLDTLNVLAQERTDDLI